jgi:DNA polymerase elongation subunit (family B)
MVARIPGWTLDQFTTFMGPIVGSDVRTEIRTDLKENALFYFDHTHEYMEIFSTNPNALSKIHSRLYKEVVPQYQRLKDCSKTKLTPYDTIFYNNTETPFRFTETTLDTNSSVYNLATKYNIPLIGGATLNTSLCQPNFPCEYLPSGVKSSTMLGLNANKNDKWTATTVNKQISLALHRDDKTDFKTNMTLVAYDIETYTIKSMSPKLPENYIFNIGIGVFNLADPKPERRISIISKDFDTMNEFSVDTPDQPITMKKTTDKFKNLMYRVYNEYNTSDDNYTDYIIVKNEKALLETFIKYISDISPQFIAGFNSFGFDDKFVYRRCERYKLENSLLQAYTQYPITDLTNQRWFRGIPTFKKFELKIDGDKRQDNKSIRDGMVISVDVYKMMLKEDAKRFTQYGKGNLDTMLEVYGIKNPYTGKSLSKTGLHYTEMFRRWDADENIYSIALYCCQDAWICGSLLVKRAKLSDFIEMANFTRTSMNDSIYRADSIRVANTLLFYAYQEGYALMDTPYKHRHDVGKDPESTLQFGGKTYDQRTIVGGDVRCIHAGKIACVTAVDYNAMYPNFKISCNADSSSRIDPTVIENPELFGLEIVKSIKINDTFGNREVFYIKKISD